MAFNFNWGGLNIERIDPRNNEISGEVFAALGKGLGQHYTNRRNREIEDEKLGYQKQLWQGQIDSNAREAEKYARDKAKYEADMQAAQEYADTINGRESSRKEIMAEIERLEAENAQLRASIGD